MVVTKKKYDFKKISYEYYGMMLHDLCDRLAGEKFSKIYGPPRGGLPIAVHLSHHFDLPLIISEEFLYNMNNWLPHDRLLIVDDVTDTGRTLEDICDRLQLRHIEHFSAVLFYKRHSTFQPNMYMEESDAWIVFPWEREDEPPNR